MPPATVASSALLPEVYTSGLEVRWLPNRGATAFASRDYSAGEVVLCEPPALLVSSGLGDAFKDDGLAPFHAFCAANKVGADTDFWCVLRPLSLLTLEALASLRHTLYSPLVKGPVVSYTAPDVNDGRSSAANTTAGIPSDSNGMPMTKHDAGLCERLFADKKAFGKCFAADGPSYAYWEGIRSAVTNNGGDTKVKDGAIFEVLQLLHACRINYHTHESSGVLGIFPNACKLSHSCNPNTFWRMVCVAEGGDDASRTKASITTASSTNRNIRDIRVMHIAERPIKAGDELSFSYAGTGINMMADTTRRRDALYPLGFVCRCDRCATYDGDAERCRGLPCLECGAVGSVRLRADNGMWACRKCPLAIEGSNFVDAGILLEAETVLESAVMAIMFRERKNLRAAEALADRGLRNHILGPILQGVHSATNPLVKRWVLVEGVRSVLGAEHYLFAVALMAFLRGLYGGIKSPQGVGDFVGLVGDGRKRYAKVGGDNAPPSSWIGTLLKVWVGEADAWFGTNMPLGTQHYALWHYADGIATEVCAKRPIPLNEAEVLCAKDLAVPESIAVGMVGLAAYQEWRS